jgi:hypothetical protein
MRNQAFRAAGNAVFIPITGSARHEAVARFMAEGDNVIGTFLK